MSFQKEYGNEVLSLLANSPTFYLIRLDVKARFIFINSLFDHTFSFLSSNLTTSSFITTLPSEDEDLYPYLMDQLRVNESILPLDIRHLQPDKKFLWIHWEFRAIKDKKGQVKEIISVGYQIQQTEGLQQQWKKKAVFLESNSGNSIPGEKTDVIFPAKNKIDHQERNLMQLQAIVDSTTNVSFFVDPYFRILAFNRQAARNAPLLHGKELQVGDSILSYMDSVQQIPFKDHFQQAIQGEIHFTEDQIHYSDTLSVWFRTEYHPVRDQNGVVMGVVLHIINIDAHKQAEKQVVESESNLRAIIDNSDSLIWLINNKYEIVDFNSHFAYVLQRFFGIEIERKQQVINQLSDKFRLKWQQRYDQALKGHKGIYLDRENFKGTTYVLEIKTFPILIEGKVRGVSIYLKDISKQQKAENKLRRQNEQLRKVNTELDKLVYSASHDLRAPLMSILGLINISKLEPDEQAKAQYLELMKGSVYKLDSFIEDILNLSRNARLEIQRTEIDFQQLINLSLTSLQYMAGNEGIEKRIFLQIEHPFYSDEKRLQVIFKNILSNSIRYRNGWQEQSWIQISVHTNQEQAIIEIADNGIGIGAAHLDKVFNIFYRASEQKTGSGLGLYIVKETVDKLKGKISISSGLDSGTKLCLHLPNAK